MSHHRRLSAAICLSAVIIAPAVPVRSASWSPGERLPPVIIAEVNRQIAGTLRAGRLSWRVPDTIEAQDVAILDPEGAPVAVATLLRAKLDVAALARRTLRITDATLIGLRLNLLSDPRGLNLARALAPTRERASDEAPLKIVIDRVEANGADALYRKDRLRVAVAGLSTTASVTAEGRRFRVVAPVRAERIAVRIGEMTMRVDKPRSARVELDEQGLSVASLRFAVAGAESQLGGSLRWGDQGGYDLRGTLAVPADYWPEGLEPVDVSTGPLRAAVRLSGPLEDPTVTLKLEPGTLRAAGWAFEELTGNVRIDRRRLVALDLETTFAGGHVLGRGQVEWESRQVSADVELDRLSLRRLGRVESLAGRLRGSGHVEGRLEAPLALALRLDGTLRGVEAGPVHLTPPHKVVLRGQLASDTLRLDRGTLRGDVLSLDLQGEIRLADREIDLGGVATLKRPQQLLDTLEQLEAEPLEVTGGVEGSFDRLRYQGHLRGALVRYSGVEARRVRARVRGSHRSVHLEELRGAVAEGTLEGVLRLDLEERRLQGSARLSGARLSTLAGGGEDVDGEVAVTAIVAGTLESPQATIKAQATAVSAGGAGPFEATTDLTLADGRLRVDQAIATGPEGDLLLTGAGEVSIADRSVDAQLELRSSSVGALPFGERLQLGGRVEGEVSVRGALGAPSVLGALRFSRVEIGGGSIGAGNVAICSTGAQLQVDALFGESPPPLTPCRPPVGRARLHRVVLHVAYDRERELLASWAQLRDLRLAPWAAKVPELAGADGMVRVDLRLEGPLSQLSGDGAVHLDAVSIGEQRLGAASLRAQATLGLTQLQMEAWDQVRGEGTFDLREGRRRLDVRLDLAGFAPEQVSATLRGRGGRGSVDGGVRLVYDPAQTPTLEVELGLRRAEVTLPPAQPIRLVGPTSVRISGSEIEVAESVLESGGSTVTLHGALREQEVSAAVRGALALPLLRLVTPEVTAAEGLCAVELDVGGSRDHPRLRGRIAPLQGATVTPRAVGKPIELAGGELLFSEQEIRANDITARGLGGAVWIDGRLELRAGEVAGFDLQARAENLQLKSRRFRAELSGDLSLRGPAAAPKLKGRIEVLEGRFSERYQLRNFTATASGAGETRSLHELLPSLVGTQLDVAITGTDLSARADMGSVVAHLMGGADLRLGGSLRDPSVTGAIDVVDGRVTVLQSHLDVESATIDFPPRADRRLVPQIDLRARTLIEPEASPTGAELPVVLTLQGDLDHMSLEVEAEDVGESISRVDLLTVLATGRSASTLLNEARGGEAALFGETSGDAALRLVSREVFGETERRVEGVLAQLAGGSGERPIDLQLLEFGATSARSGLTWTVSPRLHIDAETSVSYFDEEAPVAGERGAQGGTFRSAVRARYLLADHLPVVNSVALEADWEDLSLAEDVYSTLDLKLKMRIIER